MSFNMLTNTEKHEQNVVETVSALKTMIADLESTLRNTDVAQNEFNSYLRQAEEKIELDFTRLQSLQKGVRYAVGSEVFKRARYLYYLYNLYFDAVDHPNDVPRKRIADLLAIIQKKTRKLVAMAMEIQIQLEDAHKKRFAKIVDKVAPEVGALKTKFLGFPVRRRVNQEESEFNAEMQRVAEEDRAMAARAAAGGDPDGNPD